jgi:hypothetical protein
MSRFSGQTHLAFQPRTGHVVLPGPAATPDPQTFFQLRRQSMYQDDNAAWVKGKQLWAWCQVLVGNSRRRDVVRQSRDTLKEEARNDQGPISWSVETEKATVVIEFSDAWQAESPNCQTP